MNQTEYPSKDWQAWHNRMPGSPPTLHVTGKVTCPTGGYTAKLVPADSLSINSSIHTLEVEVTPPAAGQIVTEAITDVEVHYTEITDKPYESVEIRPGEHMVAVETAS